MTKKKGLIILLILLITVAVTTVPFVYAYFYQETEVLDTDRTFGEVKVSSNIYFQNGTAPIVPINVPTRDGHSKQGIYYVNISNLDDPYYINKLRVDFQVESTIDTFFRVKIVDTLIIVYTKANGDKVEIIVPAATTEDINYSIDDTLWYHDAMTDWYYYMDTVTIIDGLITFIEPGLQYPVHRDEYEIQFAIIIEAVQAIGGPQHNWNEPVKPWNGEVWT